MDLRSVIETILFVHGEPVSLEKLAKFTKVKKEDVAAMLEELKREYVGRGFTLLEKDGEYQFGSSPENAKYIEDFVKSEFSEELSKAALETTAIIAYQGPLTRAEIEFIRGVDSSFTLRNLLMRGLVERVENPKDARSFLYRIGFNFLKYMGVTSVKELPGYEEFRKREINAA